MYTHWLYFLSHTHRIFFNPNNPSVHSMYILRKTMYIWKPWATSEKRTYFLQYTAICGIFLVINFQNKSVIRYVFFLPFCLLAYTVWPFSKLKEDVVRSLSQIWIILRRSSAVLTYCVAVALRWQSSSLKSHSFGGHLLPQDSEL